jgi:hypothetical protein
MRFGRLFEKRGRAKDLAYGRSDFPAQNLTSCGEDSARALPDDLIGASSYGDWSFGILAERETGTPRAVVSSLMPRKSASTI